MTLTDRVWTLFHRRPNEWIDGREIAKVGGYAAYRRRITECRQQGMTIENQLIYTPKERISKYRWKTRTTAA